jgi:hypothetical protein
MSDTLFDYCLMISPTKPLRWVGPHSLGPRCLSLFFRSDVVEGWSVYPQYAGFIWLVVVYVSATSSLASPFVRTKRRQVT